MKKRNEGLRELLLRFAVVCFVLAIMIAFGVKNTFKAAFSKPYDMYKVEATDIKVGDAISTDIDMVFDEFASLRTDTKKNGATTHTSYHYYYTLPLTVSDDEGYIDDVYFIAIKVPSKDKKTFDRISNETLAWWNWEQEDLTNKPYAFTGCVKKLDDKALKYYYEWGKDELDGWYDSDKDMKKHLLPYCLEVVDLGTVRIVCIVGACLFALGVLLLVLYIKSCKKAKKLAKEEQAGNNTADYSSTQVDGSYFVYEGVKYSKVDFLVVDSLIREGRYDEAVTAVRDRSGLDTELAKGMVNNWNQIYYM